MTTHERKIERLVARQHAANLIGIIILALIIVLSLFAGALMFAPGSWDAVDGAITNFALNHPWIMILILTAIGITCIKYSR